MAQDAHSPTALPAGAGDRLEQRAARVSLVTGLSTVLSILFQLVSVPVCLAFWGTGHYGTWLALLATFQLLRSLDTGYTTYVGNKLNYLYHQDRDLLRQHLGSAAWGIVLIGSAQLALALGALVSSHFASQLGLPEGAAGQQGITAGLVIMMASWVLSGAYLGVVHRLLIPAGLMYQAAWWSMLFQVSQFSVIILAAILKLDMLFTSLLFAGSQAVIYAGSGVYIRFKLPAYFPWWQGPSLRTALSDLNKSLPLTAGNVIQQGSSNGLVLLISALAGPAALPLFTTVRTLSNLWTNVTHVFTTPLLPDVVRFHARGETQKLASTMSVYWVLVGTVVNLSVLLGYPLLEWLYGYWTGHALVLNRELLCLLLGAVVLTNFGALMSLHLNGINSLRVVLGVALVRALFALGLGALYYRQFGLASFGMGIFAGEVVVLLIVGYAFYRRELQHADYRPISRNIAAALLGVACVLFFLACAGADRAPLPLAWALATAGALGASAWGWTQLDIDLRKRIFLMLPLKR